MTYFGFLLRFLVIPIIILGLATYWDRRRGRDLPATLKFISPWVGILTLALVALIYTTPWDNYLVATGVWWYDPNLVTGIRIGWVPIEEYTFFLLQPFMTGLWLVFLAKRLRVPAPFVARPNVRIGSVAVTGAIWVASVIMLLSGWQPGNYLSLILSWALLPIMLQLAVGADILWHYRRLVALPLISASVYLCAMDAVAITSGTWTISPELSTGLMLGGVLPIEEAIFFFITNTLPVFGLTLSMAQETAARLPGRISRALPRLTQQAQ